LLRPFGEYVVVTETRIWIRISKQKPSDLSACKWLRALATMQTDRLLPRCP
jgi:hypothetical protein